MTAIECTCLTTFRLSHWAGGDYPERLRDLEPGAGETPADTWVAVPYTTTGDYDGSGALGEANRRVVVEHLESVDPEGERWRVVTGDYCLQALFVRQDFPELETDGAVGGLQGMLDTLVELTVLDSEREHEVRQEWAWLAWCDYARKEFREALASEHGEALEAAGLDLDDLHDGQLDTMWWEAHVEPSGVEVWRDENAHETMTCDAERGAKLVPLDDLAAAIRLARKITITRDSDRGLVIVETPMGDGPILDDHDAATIAAAEFGGYACALDVRLCRWTGFPGRPFREGWRYEFHLVDRDE